MPCKIDCLVGARPNFVKIAPIIRALAAKKGQAIRLIHTGQHYDFVMDAVFFRELGIPAPEVNLGVGAGTVTSQMARMMIALEPVFLARRPELLIVVGDVTSTLAATLTASKMGIPVAHVEAGLRSFDRAMPEEINRLVVDHLADLHFVTEHTGLDNLANENVSSSGVRFVGNVMIDSLFHSLSRAVAPAQLFAELAAPDAFLTAVGTHGFAYATLHRPSNVDDPIRLKTLLRAFARVSRRIPLVFAIHPRTQAKIADAELEGLLSEPSIVTTGPLSYLHAVGLMRDARMVLTDSGGIQEETTALGVPCLTLRKNTERPITVTEGTNTLVGSDTEALNLAVEEILLHGGKHGRVPSLWDGKAAERIADSVIEFLSKGRVEEPSAA